MDQKAFSSKKIFALLAVGSCSLMALVILGLSALLGSLFLPGGGPSSLSQSKVEARTALQPINPLTAEVSTITGLVEVLGSDGAWVAVKAGARVPVGQHIRTGALSSAVLAFNDGSRVTLQAGSELVIDQLDARKSGEPRQIVMTQLAGESSHEVAPNSLEGSEYRVDTPGGSGAARGTVFNVIVASGGAYYYVSEGAVAVTSMEVTVLVSAGQMTYIVIGQPPLKPVMSITGQGVLSQTGENWVVAGQSFVVTPTTVISGSPQPGDWVMVKGRVRADGLNEADWIILLRASPANRFSISGVVEAITDTQWTVQGQGISVSAQTSMDEGIVIGDRVQVEGLLQEGGSLHASSIRRLDETPGLRFEFRGIVQEIGAEQWQVSGVAIGLDSKTEIADGLGVGDLVQVEGRILADGSWVAQEIQAAADSQPGFRISGALVSLSPWKVAGISFEIRDWTVIEDGLEVGDLVQVSGLIDAQGVWIADTIERLDQQSTRLVLIGTVISTNPWVVSGISLTVSPETVIVGEIKPGMLVRVEIVLAQNGTWQVVRIQPLAGMVWFPGCMDIVATVLGVEGRQIRLLNGPVMQLAESVQIDGIITANSVVRIRICFGENGIIQIVYIVILETGEIEQPSDSGEKVAVCHKPGKKKGGHTLYVSRSALDAHLGHGDYLGACR